MLASTSGLLVKLGWNLPPDQEPATASLDSLANLVSLLVSGQRRGFRERLLNNFGIKVPSARLAHDDVKVMPENGHPFKISRFPFAAKAPPA